MGYFSDLQLQRAEELASGISDGLEEMNNNISEMLENWQKADTAIQQEFLKKIERENAMWDKNMELASVGFAMRAIS